MMAHQFTSCYSGCMAKKWQRKWLRARGGFEITTLQWKDEKSGEVGH